MDDVRALVSRVTAYHPNADVALIERAWEVAKSAHDGQKRKSGEAYFTHPVSVANLLVDLRLDTASLCAALLHDVAEDTTIGIDEIEKLFGQEVAFLVDGVTKLATFSFTSKEDRAAESFRKMLVHMARDIRVLLVKLADRLDNMRTLEHMKIDSQERIARETLDIYAPLANRLGISWMKAELEDLAFKYLEPEAYRDLEEKVSHTENERKDHIVRTVKVLSDRLNSAGFACEIQGRAKHLVSIWRKMRSQDCEYEKVYDVVAFRAVVESVADCYAALGVIHGTYTPIPGRFKDYIALPKPNLYQSLHTTVLGPDKQRMEIQIRTREMHRVAELGIAAHWKYKERVKSKDDDHGGLIDPKDARSFQWLRQLMDWQKELKDPQEFLESVKVDLFQDEVYVFTPNGDVRVFPRGATPIDFAYAIHSTLGDHCMGARVNGAIVPLRHHLRSGDVVEIMSDPNRHPTKDWIEWALTARAKSKIRFFLRTEERERSLRLGKELLERHLHKYSISYNRALKTGSMAKAVEDAKLQSVEELLIQVGYGKYDISKVLDSLVPADQREKPPAQLRESIVERVTRKVTGRDVGGILVSGESNVLVRFAKCCSAVPGDEIVGFITHGRGVSVHRRSCEKAMDLDPERRVEISWESGAKVSRMVCLRIITANRPGILAEVGTTFSQNGVNIQEANCRAGDDRATNLFSFMINDLNALKTVIRALQKVKGVLAVERV
ncbi:MAG: bifunctional (p)ppGpp synthetase/guanosine-3',5'-bis(diphosphate) 3'-pyrophosphohydrolase [Deltaproteobacteria bacterium]|nr:bifunctional (p)ppGpp synthetase/guanosine-3',5'-bis(diphosphate) 3'-pyrophosphohydrolase [Deltaproteobacteria bacterium]